MLRISERRDLLAIYKNEMLSAKANASGGLGLIYSDKGDLDQALKYLQDALKIDKEIGYRQGEANQLGNIGLIYRAKGDLDQALKYLKEALEVLDRFNLIYGIDIIVNAIRQLETEDTSET